MPDSILSSLLLVLGVGAVSSYLVLRKLRLGRLPLPPGPPSYPIIGQLLSIPRSSEGRAFIDMSAKLNSDIISFNVFGTTIIVLNSNEVANDLLEKRSNIHSGRYCPPMIASPKLINLKDFVAFMDTNELWKKQRRAMGARLNKHAVTTFRSLQELEARRLLSRLLAAHAEPMSSDFLNEEFYRTTSAVFLESVYGYELKSAQDPFFTNISKMNAILSHASLPTAFLVNAFPWMENIPDWVPGTGWKQKAYEWRDQKDRAMGDPYNWAKQRIVSGADDCSIVSLTYKELRETGWSEADADEFCKSVATGLLGAGTETSTLAMMWFVVAMAKHPEIQERAQKEIDAVVGADRLPTVADRPCLPFVERLMTEVVRWHPSAPFGAPHICTEENEYRGYRIPKGAIMVGHVTATVRDERVYQDAEKFDPDRYLDPTVPPPQAFGWGLRICPGQHFFREIFFLEIALMLATLKIERYKDENGNELVPSEETTENSSIACPVPFKVRISPRSEQHAELIRTAM
ncbi:cytochrome P450 family [Rhizoctonia solani]|uniref:Cytochrome P450 family n=1 Tax=Rhizoctonia solani TaxID=456999 RepID=A0A8H7LNJ1_9AGAM|nr:cytochrome P450 family [Rhizoctonia solani]